MGGYDSDLGPCQFDYLSAYGDGGAGGVLLVLLFLLWASYLVHLLGNTAESYFSPALAGICEGLNLPENIAGVTFLAMGNGAPDVFASLTSFSGGGDVLIGLGALLGASMFISSVVVGSLVVVKECTVNPRNFIRDVLFHILGVVCLGFVALIGKVTLLLSISFFLVYAVYVIAVVYSWRLDAGVQALLAAASRKHQSVIQQAYWYPAEKPKAVRQAASKLNRARDKYKKPAASTQKNSVMNDSESLYTFLILKENGDDSEEEEEEDGTTTINLSGGLLAQNFEHNIIEDYFAKPPPTSPDAGPSGIHTNTMISATGSSGGDSAAPAVPAAAADSSAAKPKAKFQPFDVDMNGPDDPPFVDPESGHAADAEVDQLDDSRHNLIPNYHPERRNPNKKLSSLYWTQVQLRRRLQHRVMTSDWWEYPWYYKAASVLDYPSILLRDMTIPTTDTELWSRFNAVLQPVFAPIFLLAVAGQQHKHVGAMPVTLFSMIMCIFPAIIVFLTTHTNKPPSGRFGGLWVAFSFFMCIAWIYLLAGELVACLSAVGEIMHIPSSFMGLTILAWGNSIGDYFANVAVAKQGFSEMAVTGCIGGPIFNMFIGLGLSFFYICIKEYPAPFEIQFDATSIISIAFLFVTLVGTLVIVPYRGYVLDKEFGYMLLAFYGVYTAVQFLLLLF
jgi:sodium/potassium/calcium exchanger 6